MTAPSQITKPAKRASTPEEYFQPRPNPEKKIPVDALLCALDRARAVLLLLQDNGQDTEVGFLLDHSIIMSSLWLVEGLIKQASTMATNFNGVEVAA